MAHVTIKVPLPLKMMKRGCLSLLSITFFSIIVYTVLFVMLRIRIDLDDDNDDPFLYRPAYEEEKPLLNNKIPPEAVPRPAVQMQQQQQQQQQPNGAAAAMVVPQQAAAAAPVVDTNAQVFELKGALTKQRPPNLKILFWTTIYGRTVDKIYGAEGQVPFLKFKCPKWQCEISTNRESIESAEVVLFHLPDIINSHPNLENFPTYRTSDQKWLFYSHEAPPNVGHYDTKKLNGLFNLTMNYMRESDIQHPYGMVVKRPGPNIVPKVDRTVGKTRLVAYVVSNCESGSKRELYARELGKYVPVDEYGACSKYPCEEANDVCFKFVDKTHKFYLSFENQFCVDYVTEKFFRILQLNVVPIVLGGCDYAGLFPPHSYIDVRDYESPAALAQYLQQLNNDATAYNAYFAWRRTHEYISTNGIDWWVTCKLCETLHKKRNDIKIYNDLDAWYRNDRCMSAANYYEGHIPPEMLARVQ